MYRLTVTYDGNTTPHWDAQIPDALHAFREFELMKDWGFADEYSTINLICPDGKMYTRICYRKDRKVVER